MSLDTSGVLNILEEEAVNGFCFMDLVFGEDGWEINVEYDNPVHFSLQIGAEVLEKQEIKRIQTQVLEKLISLAGHFYRDVHGDPQIDVDMHVNVQFFSYGDGITEPKNWYIFSYDVYTRSTNKWSVIFGNVDPKMQVTVPFLTGASKAARLSPNDIVDWPLDSPMQTANLDQDRRAFRYMRDYEEFELGSGTFFILTIERDEEITRVPFGLRLVAAPPTSPLRFIKTKGDLMAEDEKSGMNYVELLEALFFVGAHRVIDMHSYEGDSNVQYFLDLENLHTAMDLITAQNDEEVIQRIHRLLEKDDEELIELSIQKGQKPGDLDSLSHGAIHSPYTEDPRGVVNLEDQKERKIIDELNNSKRPVQSIPDEYRQNREKIPHFVRSFLNALIAWLNT